MLKGFFKGLLKGKQEENIQDDIKKEKIEEIISDEKDIEEAKAEKKTENIITEEKKEENSEIKAAVLEKEIKTEIKEEQVEIKNEIKTEENIKIDINQEKLLQEETAAEEKPEELPIKKSGFFASLKDKLKKTREEFFGKLKRTILGRTIIDEEMYEELEEVLIQSDIGYDMTVKIVNSLQKKVKEKNITNPEEVYVELKEVIL